MSVHNHGTEDGPGLACNEVRLADGNRIGTCLIEHLLAEAWGDGYKCGDMDANYDGDDWLDPFENPYRIEGAA